MNKEESMILNFFHATFCFYSVRKQICFAWSWMAYILLCPQLHAPDNLTVLLSISLQIKKETTICERSCKTCGCRVVAEHSNSWKIFLNHRVEECYCFLPVKLLWFKKKANLSKIEEVLKNQRP